MASSSNSAGSSPQSFDFVSGKWVVSKLVTADPEFRLLWTAYEGRNKVRFERGERGSASNIHLDIFLKLVTNQIRSTNPFSTISQAIVFYGICQAVREQDFDLLKRISDFLLDYKILSEHKWNQLRDGISLRILAKRTAEIVRLARRQRSAQEALSQRRAEVEDEAFWNSPEVAAELTVAESALDPPQNPPAQELVVLTGPITAAGSGVPPVGPLEANRSPSLVRISAEELALIVAFRQALDNKDRINWQAYQGLPEFDRLGLEAILDLADLVEGDRLPCAQVVPASSLSPIIYRRLGGPTLTRESLRSGIFYPRS